MRMWRKQEDEGSLRVIYIREGTKAVQMLAVQANEGKAVDGCLNQTNTAQFMCAWPTFKGYQEYLDPELGSDIGQSALNRRQTVEYYMFLISPPSPLAYIMAKKGSRP